MEVISKVSTTVFPGSLSIYNGLCKQRQHESIQTLGLNLYILCIRVGGNIEDTFLRKDFWEPVYPTARKEVVEDHNILPVSANFCKDTIGIVPFAAKHSVLVTSYGRAKRLNNINLKIAITN